MIDRSLNYGRALIEDFLNEASTYSSILDIGAGKGTDLAIAKRFSPNVTLNALECYKPNVELLQNNGINVYQVNIEKEEFPFPNNSVDLIIANQVIEHTKEIFWIFHEISRVLANDGKLIIGVPNLASLHNRLLLLSGFQPTAIKTRSAHIRGYTKNDFLQFLEAGFPGGYKLRDFGGSNFYPFPPILAKPLAKFLPTMAWGIFFLLEKQTEYHKSFLKYPIKEALETNFYLGS